MVDTQGLGLKFYGLSDLQLEQAFVTFRTLAKAAEDQLLPSQEAVECLAYLAHGIRAADRLLDMFRAPKV